MTNKIGSGRLKADAVLCTGGRDLKISEAELRRAPEVIIGTPGRLVDVIKNS